MNHHTSKPMTRRAYLKASAAAAGAMLLAPTMAFSNTTPNRKKRLALVGTGIRGTSFWGKFIKDEYGDVTEFVALCDTNPGRLEFAKKYIGVECPTFTNFDELLRKTTIDMVMVCTVDATHDEFIVKSLEKNIDVVTEKPMTTDEIKCQRIIDAAQKSKAKLITGFNYRYGLIFTELKQMLMAQTVGEITSVDFNWYLNTYHGASYFRRWHGERNKSGTLLLHKASHHFDLLNWWIGSDPIEVHAYGSLDFYGKNGAFRGKNCRTCAHVQQCKFFYDITKSDREMKLYVENEKYDGYIRDNCLFRNEIDIYDKMAVQIKYANNVQVSYSLTTYSPYEGFRLAFNGKNGRMETWEGIPSLENMQQDQAALHEKEMSQTQETDKAAYHEIITQLNFEDFKRIKMPMARGGHWGGDKIMFNELFKGVVKDPKLNLSAGLRDGAMAILVGVAARKSIDEARPVKIAELTSLKPLLDKWGKA